MPEREAQGPIGSVLVVGGGIAGIQASLDLAEAGFQVHLLESSPAIGGTMAQLDKTFPTNDCSMCILSPKVVECARHLNIHLMTYSELDSVEGEAGRFRVRIRHKARYVDPLRCTGCTECASVCPVEVPNLFDEGLGQRKAIYRAYPQAVPNVFLIEKRGASPCRAACPAGTHAQGYIALIAQGRYAEALELSRQANPFTSVCGRVCYHPCETACSRQLVGDEPVAIAALKRFMADWAAEHGDKPVERAPITRRERIAIVGAGPCGLTAARDLALLGYGVTVFEAAPKPGGMLRYGIPDYRLPPEVLDRDIQRILDLGITLHCNAPVRDLEALRAEFDAILLSIGAHRSLPLRIEGEGLAGVLSAVDFLRAVNSGERPSLGQRVLVIGGGNTAMDAARCARRLGAQVTIAYRRSREEMPAYAFEVAEAEAEGVEIRFLCNPVRILGEEGRVTGLEMIQMALGEPDESGRRRPLPIAGSEFILPADAIILAVGQAPDTRFLPEGLRLTRSGTLAYDEATLATSLEGVFAAGDAATGPRTAIEAVGMGHRAAEAIHRYLSGEGVTFLERVDPAQIALLDRTEAVRQVAQGAASRARRAIPAEVAPEERIRGFGEVSLGLTEEQAHAEAQRCLQCGICSECQRCVSTCKPQAIHHTLGETYSEIEVGAILLATGFDEFDAHRKHELGYGRLADVLTHIEFERLLSASGPYGGHAVRPSDGKPFRRIAFVQCVGSRDVACGNGYCSSICCMAAIKEAIIAKEHDPDVEATIFFMDLRAFGKDFDRYYERARAEYGVRFVRSRVAKVERLPDGRLDVTYTDEEDRPQHEAFDLVILSVGLEPSKGTYALTEKLGLRRTPEGFIVTEELAPLSTSRRGIFACGVATGPKDIPETVTQASAAAAEVGRLLAPSRHTLTRQKVYPPERDVAGEAPRVGVFICHCGINIAGTVDVEAVCRYAEGLPYVVYAGRNLFTCSQDTQEAIKQIIQERGINRVVVASCSPRTHEALFQETIRQVGLNPHLFELANIRDQCAWVHQREPAEATEKAKDLVRMAVSRVVYHRALRGQMVPVTPSALVLGGGLAGMTAALDLADQGYGVHLVEREEALGGNARRLYRTLRQGDFQRALGDLIARVEGHPRITVHTRTELARLEGFVGNFQSTLRRLEPDDMGEETVEHGVLILATGAQERRTAEYSYGQDPRVLTQRELEERLASGDFALQGRETIAMIQCVGSRTAEHPYCSRVCCSQALKNAIALKERYPECTLIIFYRDIRTYGLSEAYYRQAREMGVVFIPYDPQGAEPGGPPRVEPRPEALYIAAYDPILRETIPIKADWLILSVGIAPREDAEELARLLKVPRNADGFFLEAHMKLRPVEFATEGIYLAGLAHGPKSVEEAIAQAKAAAGRAATVLAQKSLMAPGTVAFVDALSCVACGDCVAICPYGAIQIVTKEVARRQFKECAEVNPTLCKACGACAAACRSGCITLEGFDDRQIFAQIFALAMGK